MLFTQQHLRLFESQGIAGVNMANVAKEAGIATGTVYIYFKSKEDSYLTSYLKTRKYNLLKRLRKATQASEPVKAVFNIMWLNYFKFSLEHYSESLFHEHFSISPLLSK
jgi:AcrR family transcriptional regulator